MSYGYGLGDFFAVIQLAKTIYDGCKASTHEYRDIGRDVGNTHIVLSAIERYWRAEEERGRDLIVADQVTLRQLAENCLDILTELQRILDKHRKLGENANILRRAKWYAFAGDMGPQRTALQENTNALAIFNATLTATITAEKTDQQTQMMKSQIRQTDEQTQLFRKFMKDQSLILEFFVTRYFEMENGQGDIIVPAFSQVNKADIKADTSDSWRNIDAELEGAGIDSTAIENHRDFMRTWIETVIPTPDDIPNDAGKDEDASTIVRTNSVELTYGSSGTATAQRGRRTEILRNDQGPQTAALLEKSTLPAPPPTPRSLSIESHHSQLSTWRDSASRDPLYAAKMVAKVLKSKYVEDSDESYILAIKRAFHYIDYTDRGWIPREVIQSCCKDAAKTVGFTFSDGELLQLVKSMDQNQDHEISVDEMIATVNALRAMILRTVIQSSGRAGRIDASIDLRNFFERQLDNQMLPVGWSSEFPRIFNSNNTVKRVFRHESLGAPQAVPPFQRSLTQAAFIASSYCAYLTSKAYDKWRHFLVGLSLDAAGEYTKALDRVIKATAQFHFFDNVDGGWNTHPLDKLWAQVDLIPIERFSELEDCPVESLLMVRQKCWELLDPIIGFVFDLKAGYMKVWWPTNPAEVSFHISGTPPDYLEWRRLRMLERSRIIASDLDKWIEIKEATQKCLHWYNSYISVLESCTSKVTESAKTVWELQEKTAKDASLHQITLEEVRIDKLPREGFRSPSTLVLVKIDSIKVGDVSPVQENSGEPIWYLGQECDVTRDSIVQLEFHAHRKWQVWSDNHEKSLRGMVKFKVRDVTNFDKYSKVTRTDGFALGPSWVKVHVTVSSRWVTDGTWKDAVGGISSSIIKRPLPPGWEPQRTKENDIYIWNKDTGAATACLWYDRLPVTLRSRVLQPLPEDWAQVVTDSKLMFTKGYDEPSPVHPEVTETATFENVISSKNFCQISDFLPNTFVEFYEQTAKKESELSLPRVTVFKIPRGSI